jgi:GntR family transcriptional regulator
MSSAVDKSSPIPLYLQLAGWIEGLITRGTLSVGSRLPSENRLASDFGLNRNTVRQAIALLVHKGLVEKQKGVGTFVRRIQTLYPIHQLGRMTSFVDDFDVSNIEIENVILGKGRVRASDEVAGKLGLRPGEAVVKVERLRIADRTPFVLEKSYYPFEVFGRLLDIEIHGSMYQLLLDEFNADLHHSVQTLRAVRPTRDIALKLGVSQSVPCIFLESMAYTSNNECIEVLQSSYRGDRYLFQVESGQYRREMNSAAVQ